MKCKREYRSLVVKVPVPWSQMPVTIEASRDVAIWWGVAASASLVLVIVLKLL